MLEICNAKVIQQGLYLSTVSTVSTVEDDSHSEER